MLINLARGGHREPKIRSAKVYSVKARIYPQQPQSQREDAAGGSSLV